MTAKQERLPLNLVNVSNLFMQSRKTLAGPQQGGDSMMIVGGSNGSIVTIAATISAPVSTDKTITITHLAITITAS